MVRKSRAGAGRRLAVAAGLAGVVVVAGVGISTARSTSFPSATPRAHCGPGSRPETDIQGRVPTADYTDGRAAKGYTCNTRQVSHVGVTGGFKVERYADAQGNVCAFYDSTLMYPKDTLVNATVGQGVVVLDMNDPRHPRRTATLTTPAMLSPHESVLLNKRRGLIAAETGWAGTYPAVLDIYSVRGDCRHPRLLSSTLTDTMGHESGFSPDGRTFYLAGNSGQTFEAVDISNPRAPKAIFKSTGMVWHGLRFSGDGRTMYVADDGQFGATSGTLLTGGGLKIVDVSQIQDRKPQPQIKVLSSLSWREVSIPQAAEPFRRGGHRYLFEVDEYAGYGVGGMLDAGSAPVGAARIINVDDPRHPWVVSDLRLQVHQPAARRGPEATDPGAQVPVQGYAAHYCSVPTRRAPKLAGCSMILSGLRIFDIRDLAHPKEVAYFNRPAADGVPSALHTAIGAFAMSEPAWDPSHNSVWYTDGNTGFFDVRLTNGVGRLLH